MTEDYQSFLAQKKVIAQTSGIDVRLEDIHPLLFPFQRTLVQWALRKGRAALFADTGLGKSFMQLEWARLTNKRTLILAPLSVAKQTVNEAKKIDVEVHYTRSGKDLAEGINITNYEMLEHFNADDFGAVVLDESSILKSLDGKTRSRLIEMFVDVPFRLCCTATPAPNDIAEIANHAEFLGVMSRVEMLAMFFVHDSNSGAQANWRLKKHAQEPFYRWLASWSMSVKKPSDLGTFSDDGYNLPELTIKPLIVETDFKPGNALFYTKLSGIQGRAEARRGTLDDKLDEIFSLVHSNQEQWILWCGMNAESSSLAKLLPDAIEVTGSDSIEKKIAAIEGFQEGKYRIVITKAKIAGYGINLQNCHNMAFVGIGDSFESYYQCIRRCYRFGQTHPVNAYIVISEIEQEIYANVMRKEKEATTMSEKLIEHVKQFEQKELEHHKEEYQYNNALAMQLPAWLLVA